MASLSSDLKKALLRFAAVAVFFVAAACAFTWPLCIRAADSVAELSDTLLNTWILAWDWHAISTGHSFFDANIFYPATKTLALSEHLVGLLPFATPVYILSHNPVLAMNAALLVSFALCGIAMFYLLRHYTGRDMPSLVGGFIFAFAAPKFGQAGHIQLLHMEFLPLALLFAERIMAEGRWSDWGWMTALLLWQILCGYYIGYIAVFIFVIFVTVRLCFIKANIKDSLLRFAVCAGVICAVMIPLSFPYMQRHSAGVVSRQDTISTSAAPLASYFTVPIMNVGHNIYSADMGARAADFDWEKTLFPGWCCMLLALLAVLIVFVKDFLKDEDKKKARPVLIAFCAVFAAMYILSLGPYLLCDGQPIVLLGHRIMLPYKLLGFCVPGFSSMRVPARFGLGVLFAFAALAGIALHLLTKKFSARISAITGCAVILLMGVEYNFTPLPLMAIETGKNVPPVYGWLAANGGGKPMIELPFGYVGNADIVYNSTRYIYFSTYHWLPLFNGYSGAFPRSYTATYKLVQNLPGEEALRAFAAEGGYWLLLHKDNIPAADIAAWNSAERGGLVKAEVRMERYVVYSVQPTVPHAAAVSRTGRRARQH